MEHPILKNQSPNLSCTKSAGLKGHPTISHMKGWFTRLNPVVMCNFSQFQASNVESGWLINGWFDYFWEGKDNSRYILEDLSAKPNASGPKTRDRLPLDLHQTGQCWDSFKSMVGLRLHFCSYGGERGAGLRKQRHWGEQNTGELFFFDAMSMVPKSSSFHL